MKFAIESSLLKSHLDDISRVLPSKSNITILEYILFEIEGTNLRLTGSDGEVRVMTSLSIENMEPEAIAFCVRGATILTPMKEMPNRVIDFELDMETQTLTANYGVGSFAITIKPGSEYSKAEMPGTDPQLTIHIPTRVLTEGIANTVYSTSTDTVRPIMMGVHMDIRPEHLSFVATNGFLLTLYRHQALNLPVEERTQLTLNRRTADLIRTLFETNDEEQQIQIQIYPQYVIFRSEEIEIQSRLLEGKYPNYEVVIPAENDKIVEADRLQMLAATSRVRIFSSPAMPLVSYVFTENKATLKANDVDFTTRAEEEVPISYTQEETRFTFRAEHMIQILRALSTENIRIKMGDSARAALILPVDGEIGVEITVAIMPLTY